jgi:glucose 1-dehydrogenase/3-oxoacyl-[acyl-carrier protein] reductase
LGNRELAGRRAVVSGADGAVGGAIARAFARAGAAVVMIGSHRDAGEAAAAHVREDGGEAVFVRAEPGADADWAGVIETAERRFGGLDILVADGGFSASARTVDLSLGDFRALCTASLKDPFLGLKHATAAIRRGGDGGSIIMIGSILANVGAADRLHDTAAKSGLAMLVKAAALELGPEKIRVNSILPVFTDARSQPAAGEPRAADPEEIAAAALFLASDQAIFMTGAEIVLDGGWTAR